LMIGSKELGGRLNQLQTRMADAGVDLVALAPTPNMRYLLGFTPHPDERLSVLLVSSQRICLVVPELNADEVKAHTDLEMVVWPDARGPREALAQALEALGIWEGVVLAADPTMRADALLILQEAINPRQCVTSDEVISALRMRKSKTEIEALQLASAQADRALMAGAEACRPGITEQEVAEAIASYFRQDGADSVDFTLIASGPNGAFPHYHAGDRSMQVGDTIILDVGATLNDYKSDITRVVHLGEPSAEVLSVYKAVREANRRGRGAAVAGAYARDVDGAARGAIEAAGYGAYFKHRTGHGLGLEVHEAPWITAESNTVLEPGMVFSVEPGVYLPGKFGIRIEDIVVVTESECRSLNKLDHTLIIKD
jgi:Xaa-Pro dipeptidase